MRRILEIYHILLAGLVGEGCPRAVLESGRSSANVR